MSDARARPLAGLDLKVLHVTDAEVTAPYRDRIAHLTVQPKLQSFVTRMLAKHKIAEGAVVMMEPSTGKILAYASRAKDGRDINVDSFAPSASVFKIVTGSTLVQVAGLTPDYKSCYFGGEQRITERELKEDPKRDVYCATLGQAMGRSINSVFARLASKKLAPDDLRSIASQFGYGESIPFDVPIETSKLEIPTDTLGFARTAAGFWNTSLSPIHGALLAATIANGGNMPRPWVVQSVTIGANSVYRAPAPSMFRAKVVASSTASSVAKMMLETVSQGTSYKAFHDRKGHAFLPDIAVAGKTGTLNQTSPTKLFTWFVGFAPADNPQVAIAVLVVNDPVWEVKANVLARKALMAFFHLHGDDDVAMPDE
jgi:cell division protein FtsI/penicillin-binding protein 2